MMSRLGVPPRERVDARGQRLAIIAASWHKQIMSGLVQGALGAAKDAGIDNATLVRVPGSCELSVAARRLAVSHDAVAVLGVVIRGKTAHFTYVCQSVTQGVTEVAVSTGVPVGFGVLMCDHEEQAFERAVWQQYADVQHAADNMGYEAVHAALATSVALRDFPLIPAQDGARPSA